MNFLGIGPAELIVILVVALVFVGPERLPRLAADLARTIREIRKYTGSLAAEFNDVIQDFEKETVGERSQWKEIGEGVAGATQYVTDTLRDARAAAADSPAGTDGAAPAEGPRPERQPAGQWVDIAEPSPQAAASAEAPAPVAANGAAPAEPLPAEDLR